MIWMALFFYASCMFAASAISDTRLRVGTLFVCGLGFFAGVFIMATVRQP